MRLKTMIPLLIVLHACIGCATHAQEDVTRRTCRLYEGVTAYIHNPEGRDFTLGLDLHDINLFAQGPREVLFKVYDPDGRPVVREIIPDDGITQPIFPERMGGWCEELQYYANLYAKGTRPSIRWSAWSDPKRLEATPARHFEKRIAGGGKGTYRVVLAGATDHYATISVSSGLKFGVVGHPNWMHGSGDQFKKSFIYIPRGTSGVFFAIAEPDMPATRTFKLTGPDGGVLYEGKALGTYQRPGGQAWKESPLTFPDPAKVEGKLLTLEVSDGPGDYLVRVTLQQPKEGVFKEYTGMGSLAVFCETPELALALKGGTFVEDGLVFWHPLQARFHRWLKANPFPENVKMGALSSDDARRATTGPNDAANPKAAIQGEILALFAAYRLLETSDGRGTALWTNWNYALGYYGCRIWRRSWVLMRSPDVPDDLKAIIREGLIMAGDRLSFASGTESVNGNAFAQIPVGLWYCHRATGDKMQKDRFEVYWDRWKNQGWGQGLGLSKSGDAQEFLAHDMHYGSYIMDNWKAAGNTWVREGGILGDATDDPRFQQVMDRYFELYTYLYCREQSKRPVPANPWSARTHQHPHKEDTNWETPSRPWKGEPGPDLTVSVNGGDEWFAARRKNYYIVTFHGRLTTESHAQSYPGQLGFGGGIICQLTVPGKGPVLASTLTQSYGTGMHPSNWRQFHLHGLVGECWDGRPLVAAISEHDDAKLVGNTVTSSGEVRNGHVKVARSYTYGPDGVDCSVQLATSDYADILSVWSWERNWSEVKSAYEVFPYMANQPDGKTPTAVSILGADGKVIGPVAKHAAEAVAFRIDRGGFGIDVKLEKPAMVMLGENATVMVQIAADGPKPTPAANVGLKYRLVPFGN